MDFESCCQEARRHLTEKRFYHCECVAESCVHLAKKYGANVEKARLAGILHDIMKDTSDEEQLKIMDKFGIMLSESQRKNQKLWHAVSGAAYIQHYMGITDQEILDAIACHTGGKSGMTLLDKVLFVADYISADRDYPGVEELRRLAESSLEEVMIEGIAFTIPERMEARLTLEPRSIDAYNEALWTLEARKQRNAPTRAL